MSAPHMLSDRYELGDTLGYGGMSEVHRGRDVRLGRDVAVKVLRADLARDPQFQERFRREAQNAAALNHPAIVAVYDTGETHTDYGPLPYIVMEYVDGRTLRDIVKTEGPLDGKRAMEVMADVCAALDFSHRHAIVHRDVKPANVMINRSGAVKVMDFGIARALADGQAAVTQTAAVIGTAQYLSPEQARGESVDARSDVYSAGCVLYELLTAEPPFTGDSPVAVAYQHVREDPNPPSTVNPSVIPELDAIVLKALAKNPANRYQSAGEMRSDLVKVLSGQRPSAPMVMTDEDRTSIMAGGRPVAGFADPDDDYYDEDYYDEEEERRRRRNKGWKRVGIVALCLAVLAGAAWLTTALLGNGDSDKIAVPSLVGQTQAAATQTLLQAKLKPNIQGVACQTKPDGTPGPCTKDKIGQVLNTNPVQGAQVAPQSTVTLYVGVQPGKVPVPSVKGLDPNAAKAKLNSVGLQVDANSQLVETDDESLIGKVMSTKPPVGTSVDGGSVVALVVGKAIDKVNLSDFRGQQYSLAAQNIENLGLSVKRKDIDSTEPEGTVISQNYTGLVPKTTTVILTVSNGNEIQMPQLVGQTQDQAQQTLQTAGWTGTFNVVQKPVTDPTQVDKILSSNPTAGAALDKTGTITIAVGTMSATPPTGGNQGPGGFPFPGG